jgi:hypothetical protein
MSRQSKNTKVRALAKQITALHLRGEKGAKQTTPKHGKDPAKRLYTKRTRGAKDKQPAKKVLNGTV